MTKIPATEEAANRLSHVLERRAFDISSGVLDNCITNIEGDLGDPSGCLRTLMSYAEASAISVWFETGDVAAFKQWFYVRAKLEYILSQPKYDEPIGALAYERRAINGIYYLISDHEGLIDWYGGIDSEFDVKRISNHNLFDFWTEQFFVALRGDWGVLEERCERVISNPPKGSREKKFLVDHKFYLALAQGDVNGMEVAIDELVSPKSIRKRASLDGGFFANLICVPAVIYSKLAWRSGYEVNVDSAYLTKEWISEIGPKSYFDEFEFMSSYVI
ncbi:immunity 49 family protein [Burkholderia vietnamiensis]|uniref:Immunity 49 family protein n=1 Tax=Burkholderia vietnamiensis TaxID=60552 RepID=A0ABS1AQL7_BURVI|nr:Imm49 family immunity protein [Burkholderia vietnamiensis]MBJ9686416.1 immunity 49 family protein [Burkholderia vietnamiensis]